MQSGTQGEVLHNTQVRRSVSTAALYQNVSKCFKVNAVERTGLGRNASLKENRWEPLFYAA
jgi:hypothetical protein